MSYFNLKTFEYLSPYLFFWHFCDWRKSVIYMPTLVHLWLNYEYCFLTLCKFSFVKIYGHSEICWPHLFWNKLPFTQIFWDNDNRCKGKNQLPLTCWQWCTRCRNRIFLKLRCKPFRFERMLVFMSTGCVKPSDCPASASNCINGVCQGNTVSSSTPINSVTSKLYTVLCSAPISNVANNFYTMFRTNQ